MENQFEESHSQILADNNFKNTLEQVRKWSKFLAILGFVSLGFVALMGLFFILGSSEMTRNLSGLSGFSGVFIGIFYLLMGLLYYFPTKYLYDFSQEISHSLQRNKDYYLKNSFESLKALFRFLGIVAIITLGMYALMILGFFVILISSSL